MKATTLLAALTLILQNPTIRATYEALAAQQGLNVIFSRNFRDQPLAAPAQDLDLLTRQTNTFFTPWDKKTILVLEDNQQNRRDYDRQFVQTLALGDKDRQTVIDSLRGRGFRQVVAGPGNTILIRDTTAQIRLAESIIANPNQPPAVLDLDGIFLAENGGQWRTPGSLRSQLKIKTTAPVTLLINESSRTIFENLANSAGVNVLFSRNFRPTTVDIALKDVGVFDALDLVSLATRTFWQPINENTFLVIEDNQQNRRDSDLHTAETIYLPSDLSSARINEILSHLRGMLMLRGVASSESAKAIVIHDTPARLILAENMIAEMTGQPIRKKLATDLRTSFGENAGGSFYTAASDRARLQIKTTAPGTISLTGNSREAFEGLAALAGLQAVFPGSFRPQPLNINLKDVDVIDAMDHLAIQTQTFWQMLDARTILVLEDNQQNRRSFQTHLLKTVYLPKETTVNGMNETLNVLRTAFTMRGVMQNEEIKAIVIHDTPQKIALAETLIEHLNPFPTPTRSVTIPAPHWAENGIFGIAAAVRADVNLKTSGPVSINLNQDARATYEALADMAGLRVNFSPDFRPGNAAPFRLQGVDMLDALDYYSLMTANSWKVVDRETILVFSNNQQNHRDLDPQVVKTFAIANRTSQRTVNGIANILRTTLTLRGVEIGDGFITVTDTPERVLLAERAIASLDIAP